MVWVGRNLKDHVLNALLQAGLPITKPRTRLGCPGPTTTSLGSLFQHLNTLSVKNLPLTSHLNLPSLSLKSFYVVLSLSDHVKNPLSTYLNKPHLSTEGPQWNPPQSEKAQLAHPVLIGEGLQPFDVLHNLPLDLFQQLHIPPVLGVPALTHNFRWGLSSIEYRSKNTSLSLLATLLLEQLRIQLVFGALSTHFWFVSSF